MLFLFSNKEEITLQLLKNCLLIILPGSQSPFTENELKVLKNYLQNEGGRILILLFEASKDDISNTNILLEEFGIIPEISKCMFVS